VFAASSGLRDTREWPHSVVPSSAAYRAGESPRMTRLYEDHADVYDIAFAWDMGDEVAWMHARLGEGCRSVLEPGCGSGRIVEAFARRGVEAVV
jgi:SAM-dependent methyltransferase